MEETIQFKVNGRPVRVTVDDERSLLDRDRDRGQPGAGPPGMRGTCHHLHGGADRKRTVRCGRRAAVPTALDAGKNQGEAARVVVL